MQPIWRVLIIGFIGSCATVQPSRAPSVAPSFDPPIAADPPSLLAPLEAASAVLITNATLLTASDKQPIIEK